MTSKILSAAILLLTISFTASAQCTTCTYTYNGTGTKSFNLNSGQTLCVNSNLSGSVNINGAGATICVANGVTFTWSSGNINQSFNLNSYGTTNVNVNINMPSNCAITVYDNGTLNTSTINFNGSGSTITNYGSWKFNQSITTNTNVTVNNYGSIDANGKNLTVGGVFKNHVNASIINVNTFMVDGSSATFTNDGTLTVTGSGADVFQVRNGATLTNSASGTVSADNARIKVTASGSTISNSGSMSSQDFTNDEAIFYNNQGANLTVTNFFENRGPSTNDGTVNIDGDFYQSNKGTNGQFVNNGLVTVGNDFTVASNGYVSGSGGFQIGGVSNNDGNVSNVDICDQTSTSGGGFDSGSGSTSNITTCSYTALPVELTYFKPVEEINSFYFQWQTATEINASHFDLQMMDESGKIEVLERISCAGNSINPIDYQSLTIDRNFTGMRYFRLVQYDFDGKKESFNWVSISGKIFSDNGISIYPNPASEVVTIDMSNLGDALKIIMIYNQNGSLLQTTQTTAQKVVYNVVELKATGYIFAEIVAGAHVERSKIKIN
ncbi:hypothetical protein GC194_14735 [bacterium]|nr:hypothetical protein [bacterium]